MSAIKDITGQKFGKLTAVSLLRIEKRRTIWSFLCDCGRPYEGAAYHVKEGMVSSCGCAKVIARRSRSDWHGQTDSPEHSTWTNMWTRCTNRNSRDWPDYGGRGISVCERWKDFKIFFADVGEKPSPAHSIDRIDVNGNYEPGNVRWATPTEQRANRRDSVRRAA